MAELRWAALNLGLMVALAAFAVVDGDAAAGFGGAAVRGGGAAARRFGAVARRRGGSGR